MSLGTAGTDHTGGPNHKTLSFETGVAVALTEQDSTSEAALQKIT